MNMVNHVKSSQRSRIASLDVLRGLAICGILLVNIPPMWNLLGYAQGDGVYSLLPVRHALDLFVQARFFPLFSLLFGIGFGLMWASAARKAAHPRLVMLRRFAFLAVVGLAHQFMQPGEALLPYAIVALIVLLPMTFLPERAQAITAFILGLLGTLAAVALGGSAFLIPGLFLLGFAAARLHLPERAQRYPVRVAIALAVALAVAVPLLILQAQGDPEALAGGAIPAAAGLALATVYALTIALLMSTPARAALEFVFAPLGRTAFTNYLTATLMVLAMKPALGVLGIATETATNADWLRMLVCCVVLLTLQRIAAGLWLRRFEQGPLEWLWRRVTWWDWGSGRQAHASASEARVEITPATGADVRPRGANRSRRG